MLHEAYAWVCSTMRRAVDAAALPNYNVGAGTAYANAALSGRVVDTENREFQHHHACGVYYTSQSWRPGM